MAAEAIGRGMLPAGPTGSSRLEQVQQLTDEEKARLAAAKTPEERAAVQISIDTRIRRDIATIPTTTGIFDADPRKVNDFMLQNLSPGLAPGTVLKGGPQDVVTGIQVPQLGDNGQYLPDLSRETLADIGLNKKKKGRAASILAGGTSGGKDMLLGGMIDRKSLIGL